MKKSTVRKIITIATLALLAVCLFATLGCEEKKENKGKYVDYDMTYYLENIDLWNRNFTSLLDCKKTYLNQAQGLFFQILRLTPIQCC